MTCLTCRHHLDTHAREGGCDIRTCPCPAFVTYAEPKAFAQWRRDTVKALKRTRVLSESIDLEYRLTAIDTLIKDVAGRTCIKDVATRA